MSEMITAANYTPEPLLLHKPPLTETGQVHSFIPAPGWLQAVLYVPECQPNTPNTRATVVYTQWSHVMLQHISTLVLHCGVTVMYSSVMLHCSVTIFC